jgi:ribosomal protein S18 acetylase RimI-like enzyme
LRDIAFAEWELNMIELRKAEHADIPFLVSLRNETMGPHQLKAGMAVDEQTQLARVLYRFECAGIVRVDGVDVGLLKLDRDARPWRLVQIQLRPGVQGRGLGEKLVRAVVDEAVEAGVAVELSVLKFNPARRLYERCGFRVIDEQEREYLMLARDGLESLQQWTV